MAGLIPRKGSKSPVKLLQFRVNVQLSKPGKGDGLSDEVAALFDNGTEKGLSITSSAFTFTAPIDATLTPSQISDALYSYLGKIEDKLLGREAVKVAEGEAEAAEEQE